MSNIENGIKTLADALRAQIARDIAAKQERDTVAAILRAVNTPFTANPPLPTIEVRRCPAEKFPPAAVERYKTQAVQAIGLALSRKVTTFWPITVEYERNALLNQATVCIQDLGLQEILRVELFYSCITRTYSLQFTYTR